MAEMNRIQISNRLGYRTHFSFPIYAQLPFDISSALREMIYSVKVACLDFRAPRRNFPFSASATDEDQIKNKSQRQYSKEWRNLAEK